MDNRRLRSRAFIVAVYIGLLTLGSCRIASEKVVSVSEQTSGVLQLDAQASQEVVQDTVQMTLFTETEGGSPKKVANTLNRATDKALKIVKKQTAVFAQTGQLSVWSTQKREGRLVDWRGRVEILLTAKDIAAAAQLAGTLSQWMQISGVRFSLSESIRSGVERGLIRQAVTAFHQKAELSSRALGYRNYAIREVRLSTESPFSPVVAFKAYSMGGIAASATPTLPSLQAGKIRIGVSLSGTIQMRH